MKCPHCYKETTKPQRELPKLGDIVYPQPYQYGWPNAEAEIVYIAPEGNKTKVEGKHRIMLKSLKSGDYSIGTLEHCRKKAP